jgi:hypothetical protein
MILCQIHDDFYEFMMSGQPEFTYAFRQTRVFQHFKFKKKSQEISKFQK